MILLRLLITLAAVLYGAAAAVSGQAAVSDGTSTSMTSHPTPPGFMIEEGIVIIGDTVTLIPPYAFADREDILEVRYAPGSRLREIGEYAFLGCQKLTGIKLPDSVSILGEGCFRECGSLRSMVIPDFVEVLPNYMFAWDTALESVTLPARLRDIGSHSFVYCTSLRRVAGPETTVKAGPDVTVTVMGTVTGGTVETDAGALIPDGVTHIGSNAFAECRSLPLVIMPASVTELESYAFAECVSLREAVLPANDSLLGELIFSGCRSLTRLYEYSPVPPRFDCDSYIFEPDETELYRRCRLETLPEAAAYATVPGWSLFRDSQPVK